MINKKTKFIELAFFILAFSLLFTSFVSAENPYCEITTLANCNTLNGDIVMKLSSTTNAHGANNSETLYPQVLCCVNFEEGLGTTCNGKNRLLKLSSSTNAHAESPSYTNYSTDICYEGFYPASNPNACYALRSDFSCGTNENEIIYLSDYGNAHLGDASSSYGVKICCEVKPVGIDPSECQLSSASWAVAGETVSSLLVGLDVDMSLTGNAYCGQATEINYTIYDTSNKLIGFSKAKFSSKSWTTILPTGVNEKNYYFNASALIAGTNTVTSSIKSGNLRVFDKDDPENPGGDRCEEVQSCEDYTLWIAKYDEDSAKAGCIQDDCSVAINGPMEDAGECWWDDINKVCNNSDIVDYCGDTILQSGEECDGDWNPDIEDWVSFMGRLTENENWDSTKMNDTCYLIRDRASHGNVSCTRPNIYDLSAEQCTFDYSPCIDETIGSCGNNKIDNVTEECDGTDFGTLTCYTLTGNLGGDLSCTSDCKIDASECCNPGDPGCEVPEPVCGNSIFESENNEECEGRWSSEGLVWTFMDFGQYGTSDEEDTCKLYFLDDVSKQNGELKCYPPTDTEKACELDLSDCGPKASCGDNICSDEEDCLNCPSDCGSCTGAHCGDGDCGADEGCYTCSKDCACVGDTVCSSTTNSCVNPASKCGNGILDKDINEKCDGSLFNEAQDECKEIDDYISGDLTCTSSCTFNKSKCYKPDPIITPKPTDQGTCIYTTTSADDTCDEETRDDDFFTYSWTAQWNPAKNNPTQPKPASCAEGYRRIDCPAAIPLPFFDWITLVVTVMVIALVYLGTKVVKAKKR